MAEDAYFRPIVCHGAARPGDAVQLAGGPGWFTHAERLTRHGSGKIISVSEISHQILENLSVSRSPVCGLSLNQPRLMGVLNTTPDSFSDGGKFADAAVAIGHAKEILESGADILDVGGESTRPGADTISDELEIERTQPVIKALTEDKVATPIAIDTRKSEVAAAAFEAGAGLLNDVSALSFDEKMAEFSAETCGPVCLMHASGDPKTMQQNPHYDDVLLDVYDYLAERIKFSILAGIERKNIIVDPGIGFGKTKAHNLALIRGISLYHGLGCPILLGVSRKRFIGTISSEPVAENRVAGSIAVGLEGVRQGVQVLRVHDIRETKQALALWSAVHF